MDGLIRTIIGFGELNEAVNMRSLKKGISDFLDEYLEIPLKDIEVGKMLLEFIDLVSTHRIKMHPDLTMLVKVLVIVPSASVSPDAFNVVPS